MSKFLERNLKVLVTSGGTKVKIDLVRNISNMSKGTFGSRIAREFLDRKYYDVTFLMAKESKYPEKKDCSEYRRLIEYVTFDDYARLLDSCLSENPDIIVLAAAVSDYGVENYMDGKIRSGEDLIIRLKPLPKLISAVRKKCPKAVICGFKLLVNSTDDELYAAVEKSILTNDCDLVVGNDLRDIKEGKHRLLLGSKTYSSLSPVKFDVYHQGFDSLSKKVVDHCELQYNHPIR